MIYRFFSGLLVLAGGLLLGCAPGPRVEVSSHSAGFDAGGLVLTWQLTSPGYSRVEIWEVAHPATRRESATRAHPGVQFREALSGLAPDTEHAYQIAAGATAVLDGDAVRTAPATIRTPPAITISDVAVQVEAMGARVSWSTNRPTDSTVVYGRTGEFEARKSNPAQVGATAHTLALTGLEPAQTYLLKVVATDPEGRSPVTHGAPVSFTTPASRPGEVTRIMPQQGPRTNTLAELSRDYLKRLRSLSAADKKKLEAAIRDQAPADRIELSPAERAELAAPTDPADAERFSRRVELVNRWIIHLGQRGKDVGALANAAVSLSNRYFVAPAQAATELDRTVKDLAALE